MPNQQCQSIKDILNNYTLVQIKYDLCNLQKEQITLSCCTVPRETGNKPTSNMQCVIVTVYIRRCHQCYQCTMLSKENCDKCKCNYEIIRREQEIVPDVLEKSWQRGGRAGFQQQFRLHTDTEAQHHYISFHERCSCCSLQRAVCFYLEKKTYVAEYRSEKSRDIEISASPPHLTGQRKRLFSKTGTITADHRSNVKPHLTEQLLLSKN